MRFLIDEDLPRSTANLLRQYGHEGIDIRDLGLRGSKDYEIIAYAQSKGLCLLTGDFDFSDIRNYPPLKYSGIVVLQIPENSTASFILHLLERFLQEENLVKQLSGGLAIVEPGRVRIRRG